jgi:nucleoside-diphosphate-sugar epimerase
MSATELENAVSGNAKLGKVIILGAKGRFGRATESAFVAAGWRVRAFARDWQGVSQHADIEHVTGDAFDADCLARAAAGCDLIIHALNPPYPRWQRNLPRLTANVIHAAKISGATVMIPGNVYNYGADMPPSMSESTAHRPTSRKGGLRHEMEQAFERAARGTEGANAVRSIILRAGDFIERQKSGNWFDSYISANIAKGRVMYPGPLDRMHAWAYLPDMARAMVGLAEKRGEFAAFEQFGFAGYALTGQALIDAMARTAGHELKVKGLSWALVRLLGLAMPQMREITEMSYLWRVPHAIDGTKLAAVLPEFQPTPLVDALADALGGAHRSESTEKIIPLGKSAAPALDSGQ